MTRIGCHEDLNHETLRQYVAAQPELSPEPVAVPTVAETQEFLDKSREASRLGRSLRKISELNGEVECLKVAIESYKADAIDLEADVSRRDLEIADLQDRLVKSQSDLNDKLHVILNLRNSLDAAHADARALRERFGVIE